MEMMLQFITAMLGTCAFAVLFHAPQRFYAPCGICGAVGWVVYLIAVQEYGAHVAVASMVASIVLAIVSGVLAIEMKAPATTFLVTGIFPLVPGADIYYTAYYMIQSDLVLCAEKGVETLMIAGGIALGLLIGTAVMNLCVRVLRHAVK